MSHAAEMRRCLETGDIAGIRKLSKFVNPHLPQPKTDAEAETALHMARVQTENVSLDKRAYSHKWLMERGLPSMLPDRLKASAERLYPRVASAVGISVNMRDPDMKPVANAIEQAMSDAVEDAYAHRNEDPVFVKARMEEARKLEKRRLFGMTGLYAMKGAF